MASTVTPLTYHTKFITTRQSTLQFLTEFWLAEDGMKIGMSFQNASSKQKEIHQINFLPWFQNDGVSLTAISNKIFAIGGSPNKNTMETINLNTADRQWKKEVMPFSVYHHCSVGLGNSIIVTGEMDKNLNVSKIILKFLCIKQ